MPVCGVGLSEAESCKAAFLANALRSQPGAPPFMGASTRLVLEAVVVTVRRRSGKAPASRVGQAFLARPPAVSASPIFLSLSDMNLAKFGPSANFMVKPRESMNALYSADS